MFRKGKVKTQSHNNLFACLSRNPTQTVSTPRISNENEYPENTEDNELREVKFKQSEILLLIRENLYKQVVQSFATPITQSTGTSPTEKGEHPHKAFLKKLPLPHTSSLPNSTDKCPNPVE